MAEWVDVVAADSLAPGERVKTEVEDVEIIVCRVGDEFFAVEDLCSHEAYPLEEGVVEDSRITCPLHGAAFCLRTGEALSPPAYAPIAVFPTRIENGVVQVRDDRWD